MKLDNKPVEGRISETIRVGNIQGMNRFDPHLELPQNQFQDINNLDLFPGYLKSRGSMSESADSALPLYYEIVSKVVWRTSDGQDWVIAHILEDDTVDVYHVMYRGLYAGGSWIGIEDYDVASGFDGTPDPWEPDTDYPIDFILAEDRMICFHPTENSVIEYFTTGVPFRRRELGLTKVYSTTAVTGVGALDGDYIYGIEVVYKKGAYDFLSSGVNRYDTSATPKLQRVTTSSNNVTISAPSVVAIGDNFWSHIRLWRTKRLDKAAVEDNIPGNETELYVIQEITRASWAGSFAADELSDDALPNLNITGATVATVDDLELEPLPGGEVGAYKNGIIFVSRCSDIDDTNSNVYYSNGNETKYAEQYKVGQLVRIERGDGQQVIKLMSFERDLIVFKQFKTGRIANGNPSFGFEILDSTIGIGNKDDAKFINKLGIVGITQDRIKIFGYDLRWSEVVGGIEFTRHVREGNPENGSPASFSDHQIEYWDGKLMWFFTTNTFGNYSTRLYVFHLDQRLGWSRYTADKINSEGNQMFLSTTGTLFFQPRNDSLYSLDAGNSGEVDDDGTNIPWSVTPPVWKHDGGRSIIEQRYFSVMAGISKAMTVTVLFSDGLTMYSDEPFELDPEALAIPHSSLDAQEYQYFAKRKYPDITKIYGRNFYYTISGEAQSVIYSMNLECFIQHGNVKPFFTKHSRDDLEDPMGKNKALAFYSSGIVHWITRSDVNQCREHKLDTSDPIERQVFLFFKAE